VVVDVACSVCGKHVGSRELYPSGVPRPAARGGDGPRRRLDRHWEYLDDGDRYGNSELSAAEYERALGALTGPHPEPFAKLYCHACDLVYCSGHWAVEYSNEPPVCVGRCPKGHWHVIDMG